MDFFTILNYIGILDTILLLVMSFLIYFYRFRFYRALKILGFFLFFSFLIQTTAITIPHLGFHNLWLLHILTLGEFVFLSLFFRELFTDKPKIQKTIIYTLPIGFCLIILNSLFLEPLTDYNNNAKTFVQCVIIIYSVYYFYILSTREILTDQRFKALHLINSAILLYYAGTFFIFMATNISVLDAGNMGYIFWIFNAFLYFIFLIIILISLYKIIRK